MNIWIEKSRKTKSLPSYLTVGVSWIDIFTGKTHLSQFMTEYNHNPSTYDELERLVTIYNPSETIIITNMDNNYIDDIISFANINSEKIHKISLQNDGELKDCAEKVQKQTYQQDIFKQFFPQTSSDYLTNIYPTHILAIQSFIFLLDFIYKHNPNLVDKLSFPVINKNDAVVLLANHSLQQLNIIDNGKHTGHLKSIGDMLNQCKTTMGKRKFFYNIHNPINDSTLLNASYDITEYVMKTDFCEFVRQKITGIRDLERMNRKIIMKRLVPKDLGVIVNDLTQIISLEKKVRAHKSIQNYIDNLRLNHQDDTKVKVANKINKLCKTIIDKVKRNFYIEKCVDLNNITYEYLSSLGPEKISFVKPGICESIDIQYDKCIGSKNKLEAIAKWFSSLISNVEKKGKTGNYIKIHETSKTEPQLVGTMRRINFLQEQIKKLDSNKIKLNYIDVNGNASVFTLDIDGIQYNKLGNSKNGMRCLPMVLFAR